MKRRIVLGGAVAAGASLSFPAPAIVKGLRRLTMVSDWPDAPGLLPSARRLARTIGDASGGRLEIEVYASGELIRPFETFEAVRSGVADMFHTHSAYFGDKSQAFQFYSGVPFGLTPGELFAWVRHGGGQALWDELGEPFAVKSLLCCSTGTQMGGWFVDEIDSIEGFRELRYRMAGLGAEVYRRLGAAVVLVPAADIVQSLRSGAIDACEWAGPWLDTAMGLHEVADHYYYPGWHEPSGAVTLGINTGVWESLDAGDRRLIEIAAASEYAVSLAEFDTNNARALAELRADERVTFRRFDDAMLTRFAEIGADVVDEAGSGDALARRIYASYRTFHDSARAWSDVGEGAFLGARAVGG